MCGDGGGGGETAVIYVFNPPYNRASKTRCRDNGGIMIPKIHEKVEVNKREFVRNTYKYLVPGAYVVTNRGEPEYLVTVHRLDNVYEFEVFDESGHDF